jgi:hypothetical protein
LASVRPRNAASSARGCRASMSSANRLGHADPSITLRVYAHVASEQLAEAADIFARAIPESEATVSKSVSKKAPPEPGRGL